MNSYLEGPAGLIVGSLVHCRKVLRSGVLPLMIITTEHRGFRITTSNQTQRLLEATASQVSAREVPSRGCSTCVGIRPDLQVHMSLFQIEGTTWMIHVRM